jgi:hypothetical protein
MYVCLWSLLVYGAPKLPCIVTSIRVALKRLRFAGFSSECFHHMDEDQLVRGSIWLKASLGESGQKWGMLNVFAYGKALDNCLGWLEAQR